MAVDNRVYLAGYACRYPDAAGPAELLANIVAKRQSFRRIPDERLPMASYLGATIGEADSITPVLASLLTDWHFDPQQYRIPKDAFASTDLVHWLALEVACGAIAQCGGAESLPRDTTGVVVANTLTGEFSRTSQLRLRWPWLDHQLAAALDGQEIDPALRQQIREGFRDRINSALPAPNEETLAGGLANTIAGRIANYFDLHGGAWLVDAACASSLVAVANAAEQIACGRADVMIVVGVDLSLDPFELVGFSRNGALTAQRMRVFDRRADGFWPGEGAGALVLGSAKWVQQNGTDNPVELAGWGLSSDGSGGLTRPEVSGQYRALQEAYGRFGLDPADLAFVEAHGTGTAIGDPTEVEALAQLLGPGADGRKVSIGSIKGNIGHTKAAAGMAGMIKAAEALRMGIVPPHTGCSDPHPVFARTGNRLAVADTVSALPSKADTVLAGVSSFGFGGINAHAVLRSSAAAPAVLPSFRPWSEDELFAFAEDTSEMLDTALELASERARALSVSEMRDFAAQLARKSRQGRFRIAFVAGRPDEFIDWIAQARQVLAGGESEAIHFGKAGESPRVGLLFPGQGAPSRVHGGAWAQRFDLLQANIELVGDPAHTRNAQPLVIGAALAGLQLLDRLGVKADVALGHSLGEIAALQWAGWFDRDHALAIAAGRGRVMGALAEGAMLLLACEPELARLLIDDTDAEVACLNAHRETVVSGPAHAVEEVLRRAAGRGISAQPLPVSHAFHSRMMAAAEPELRDIVVACPPKRSVGRVMSTVTGDLLDPHADIAQHLVDQLTLPVRFVEAAELMVQECDIVIEVGPGASMTRLFQPHRVKTASLDVFAATCRPAFECLARLHAAGIELNLASIYPETAFAELRSVAPSFLENPCGGGSAVSAIKPSVSVVDSSDAEFESQPISSGDDCLEQLCALVSEKTGLAPKSLTPELRFLDDLHFNSLAVSRILARLAQHRGIQLPGHRTAFANASLQEVADELIQLEALGPAIMPERIAGIAPWVRRFEPVWAGHSAGPLDLFDWHEVALGDPIPARTTALAIRIDAWDASRDGPTLFAAVRQACVSVRHLALLHRGAALEGFVGSLKAEGLFDSIRAIDVSEWDGPLPALPGDHPVLALDQSGSVRRAAIRLALPDDQVVDLEGNRPSVIVVTGGARGIGAEVAIELGKRSGAALILVGRSPIDTPDVAALLDRAAKLNLQVGYAQADVEEAGALAAAVRGLANRFGAPSHLVHTAGINEPTAFMDIEADRLRQTLGPKSQGLLNAVAACGPDLRRVVGFGSIIGRLGLAGECHYALANAEQGRLLADAMKDRPELATLNIEWSVWAGAGMGDRLGVIDQLSAEGIDAIPLAEAIDQACDLILSPKTGAVLVTSRFGSVEPAPGAGQLRFLDQVLVHTPRVELVVEATLNHGRDPYLLSHVVDGVPVMPGVMMLEAMTQVASQLLNEKEDSVRVAGLSFQSAVTVGIEARRIRIAAMRSHDGSVACEIRSEEDNFAEPVVRAALHFGTRTPAGQIDAAAPLGASLSGLYGPLFFHGQAFQRLDRLGALTSRKVEANLLDPQSARLFGAFEPNLLLLGDPVARDCGLHLLQACVPHRRVLPIKVGLIEFHAAGPATGISAVERWAASGDYAFDITFFNADGAIVERWHEAVFRTIGSITIEPIIDAVPELIGPYLERLAREATGEDSLQCALVSDPRLERAGRRSEALEEIGLDLPSDRRGDGAPVFPAGVHCSLSHTSSATLAVRSQHPVGCDLVMLDDFAERAEAQHWAASESLRKIGAIGEVRYAGDSIYRLPTGERALILSQFSVDGVPHLASIAISSLEPG